MGFPTLAARPLAESCGPGTYPCAGGGQSLAPLWWLVGAFGLVVLCFAIYSVTESTLENKTRTKGVATIARVTKIEPSGGKSSPGYLKVYFDLSITRPDGTEFTAQHRTEISLLEPPKAGWEYPVRYLESRNSLPRIVLTGPGGPAVEDARPERRPNEDSA